MKIGIIAFTENGNKLLKKIVSFSNEVFDCYDKKNQDLKLWISERFEQSDAIIFIGAVGIAVRLISGLIRAKDTDPAVIVIDEFGQYVIPVLSGHIGGANVLAGQIADQLNAIPIITTATDMNNKFAADVWSGKAGCVIDDISKIKEISSRVLKNEKVGFQSDFEIFGKLPDELCSVGNYEAGITVSVDQHKKPFPITLNVIPKIITIGVGCKKDTAFEEMEAFILKTLEANKISIKAVKYISSIEIKKDEVCLRKFSEKYKIAFTTFDALQLNAVKGVFQGSEFVRNTTGVDNVCERSAVLQSGGKLILGKTAQNGMTIAIAASKWRCEF